MNEKIIWESITSQNICDKFMSLKEYKHLCTSEFKKAKKEIKLKIIKEFENGFEKQLQSLVLGIFFKINFFKI
jgi:hypothetical protein